MYGITLPLFEGIAVVALLTQQQHALKSSSPPGGAEAFATWQSFPLSSSSSTMTRSSNDCNNGKLFSIGPGSRVRGGGGGDSSSSGRGPLRVLSFTRLQAQQRSKNKSGDGADDEPDDSESNKASSYIFTEFNAVTPSTISTPSTTTVVSLSLLEKQNAETSNSIIEYLDDSSLFQELSKYEGQLTIQRDVEDSQKLQKGIDYAISKGVISDTFEKPTYCDIDVLGKSPDDVAKEILSKVDGDNKDDEDAMDEGSIIVICGLSGTGKGTTVAKICQQLQDNQGQKVVNWSNGNIFRSITLLAVKWCEQNCDGGNHFDKEKALTPENLSTFFNMLEFGLYNDKYDIRIKGIGMDTLVSEAQNTVLKAPEVAKNIPTVAEMIQGRTPTDASSYMHVFSSIGSSFFIVPTLHVCLTLFLFYFHTFLVPASPVTGEVINFASDAIERMKKDGYYVLVEGREQTVNYIQTTNRFNLMLSDPSLIGKRRAAQRLMANAFTRLKQPGVTDGVDDTSDDDETASIVAKILQDSLRELTKDLPSHASKETKI